MIFPLELWANILKYTDALSTVCVAKTCKQLYELIQIYLENKLIAPIPATQTTLEITKVHASHEIHILSVDLPADCLVRVFKDTSSDSCSVYKMSNHEPSIGLGATKGTSSLSQRLWRSKLLIDLTFPDLRSPNQKIALIFKVLKTLEIEYKCLTSKLNMELHHNKIYQWWIGTNNVMLTPRTKKTYREDVGDWYFYFPISKRRESKGYKVKISNYIFVLHPLQPLYSK